jgi:hypothetical protein
MNAVSVVLGLRELEQSIARVVKFRMDSAGCYWRMGKEIRDIHENQLWKLRVEVDERGKANPRWKTWEAFCNAELKMSSKSVASAMDVAANFTEEQVRTWGRSKLHLVLQASPELRSELIARVAVGTSHRELERLVRDAKAKDGFVRASRGVRGGARMKSAEVKKALKVAQRMLAAELRKRALDYEGLMNGKAGWETATKQRIQGIIDGLDQAADRVENGKWTDGEIT